MNDTKQAKNQSLCFIDSNIWLYALLPNQEVSKEQQARSLIQQNHDTIVISDQVVREVVNNMIRKGNVGESDIRTFIHSLYSAYIVVSTEQSAMEKASFLRENGSFSYWDSLIVAAALEAGVSILYSEDMHNGLVVENQLTIRNPFAGA